MTDYPWEFGYIVDEQLRDTGFAVVRGHLDSPEHLDRFKRLKQTHHIIGMTCQGVFPMIGELPGNLPAGSAPGEGRQLDYVRDIAGWTHCFREPSAYLPDGVPRVQFSNSDNMDPERIWAVATRNGARGKRWDFIYTCLAEPANVIRKNWDLARRCAMRFAQDLGLKGLLVGVAGLEDAPAHPLIDVTPELRWSEFLACLRQARTAIFPNTWDPSPRTLAEALCLDVPVLVNHSILGGWHYVCPTTGTFFDGEADAPDAILRLLSEQLNPREWYCDHYGQRNAGPRLAEFLRQVSPPGEPAPACEAASFYSPRDWNGVLPGPQ